MDENKHSFEVGQAVVSAWIRVGLRQVETAYAACAASLEAEQQSKETQLRDRLELSPGEITEEFRDAAIDLDEMLEDVRGQVRLAFMTALFHWWERQSRGITKTKYYDHVAMMTYLKTKGVELDGESIYILKLTVNASKHGSGDSMDELRNRRPDFIVNDEVVVSGDQMEAFLDLFRFWKETPYPGG